MRRHVTASPCRAGKNPSADQKDYTKWMSEMFAVSVLTSHPLTPTQWKHRILSVITAAQSFQRLEEWIRPDLSGILSSPKIISKISVAILWSQEWIRTCEWGNWSCTVWCVEPAPKRSKQQMYLREQCMSNALWSTVVRDIFTPLWYCTISIHNVWTRMRGTLRAIWSPTQLETLLYELVRLLSRTRDPASRAADNKERKTRHKVHTPPQRTRVCVWRNPCLKYCRARHAQKAFVLSTKRAHRTRRKQISGLRLAPEVHTTGAHVDSGFLSETFLHDLHTHHRPHKALHQKPSPQQGCLPTPIYNSATEWHLPRINKRHSWKYVHTIFIGNKTCLKLVAKLERYPANQIGCPSNWQVACKSQVAQLQNGHMFIVLTVDGWFYQATQVWLPWLLWLTMTPGQKAHHRPGLPSRLYFLLQWRKEGRKEFTCVWINLQCDRHFRRTFQDIAVPLVCHLGEATRSGAILCGHMCGFARERKDDRWARIPTAHPDGEHFSAHIPLV